MSGTQKRYLQAMALSVAVPMTVVLLVNLIVDPFRVYRLTRMVESNSQTGNLYTTAAENFRHARPRVVMVGSSRVVDGIRDQSVSQNELPFKVAVRGTSWTEQKQVLRYLMEDEHHPDKVIFGLDLDTVLRKSRPSDFHQSRFSQSYKPLDYHACNLLSMHAFKKSASTLFRGSGGSSDSDQIEQMVQRHGSNRVFEKQLQRRIEMHSPAKAIDKIESAIIELDQIVVAAREKSIDFQVVMLPIHALSLEKLYRTGYGDSVEYLKREVSRVVAKHHVSFWDFTGYTSVTTESVPSDVDSKETMRWFYDSDHFTPELGERVLNAIVAQQLPEQPHELGVLVTQENIDSHLRQIQELRRAYLATSPWGLQMIESRDRVSSSSRQNGQSISPNQKQSRLAKQLHRRDD